MRLTARGGAFASSVSILVNITALAGSASAFFETNRRPVVVEAQSVELSLEARDPTDVAAAAGGAVGTRGLAGHCGRTRQPSAGRGIPEPDPVTTLHCEVTREP